MIDAQLGDLGRQASAGITTVERLIEQIDKYPQIVAKDRDFSRCMVGARYFLMTGRLIDELTKGDKQE